MQNGIGDADLAHIMQQGAALDMVDRLFVQTVRLRQRNKRSLVLGWQNTLRLHVSQLADPIVKYPLKSSLGRRQ